MAQWVKSLSAQVTCSMFDAQKPWYRTEPHQEMCVHAHMHSYTTHTHARVHARSHTHTQ